VEKNVAIRRSELIGFALAVIETDRDLFGFAFGDG